MIPDDDLALVGIPWLIENGHGKRVTIWRKTRDGRLPPPDFHDPNPKWIRSTLKRHLDELQQKEAAA